MLLKVTRMLSEISHPDTKALCVGDIMCGKMLFIRLARNFAIILYMTLQKRLMGLKSAIYSSFFFFLE